MIATVIRSCFPIASAAVAAKADEINKLNVFPVPDGDTGTNMSLTLATVVKEIEQLPPSATIEDVAAAITHGSLMGARGNSGVITSQILRGIAEGLCSCTSDVVCSADIAAALRNGVKVAFKAVRKPVEGTILTVLKDMSHKADELEKAGVTKQEMLDAIVVEAYESVARTPELLPVLKENGVVDSGAFGFAVFVEAFVNAYTGSDKALTNFATTIDTSSTSAKSKVADVVDIEVNDDWEGSAFTYCTEFLFKAHKSSFNAESNLKYLSAMGDCELLVGSFPDYKIHVHTNRPDYILRHMLHRGVVYNVFVHNMDIEANERTEAIRENKVLVHAGSADAPVKTGADAQDGASTLTTAQAKLEPEPQELIELGFVSVAAGSGQAEILESLGVTQIVQGGQTMNPSTADIFAAIKACHARNVIVLPNNSNIRMAAEAAATAANSELADCHVYVVPTKSVLQAFSVMFAVEETSNAEELAQSMTEQLALIRDGEVTCAVRDSTASTGAPIHAGDVMGIAQGSIDVVGSSVQDVTLRVIGEMLEREDADTLTILAGSDLSDADFETLVSAIEDAFPQLDVDPQRGEQPLYPVIFSLE